MMELDIRQEKEIVTNVKKTNPLLYKLKRSPMTWLGLILIGIILLATICAPLLTSYDPNKIDMASRFQAPSSAHWFGTDEVGRDIFTRVLFGARLSLGIGVFVVLLAGCIGLVIGTVTGYLGGWWDQIVMRTMDMLLAFPTLILAMAIAATLGAGMVNVLIAIIIVKVPTYVRLARGETLSVRERLFVKAAESFGISRWRIIGKHIIPNVISPLIIQITLDIGEVILLIATLGFLGLGAQPPSPEWGAMISIGWKYLLDFWWYPTFPCVALFLSSTALNLIGDGVRDILDPRATR